MPGSTAARLSPFHEGAAIPPNTEGRVSVLKTRGAGAANAEAALRLISDSNAETTQTTTFEATQCEFHFGGLNAYFQTQPQGIRLGNSHEHGAYP
jgi:hypothetical protein